MARPTLGFTGHQNGLIGQSARMGVSPSQPASIKILRPTSGPDGSKVQAVSVPERDATPSSASTPLDASLRAMISASWQ